MTFYDYVLVPAHATRHSILSRYSVNVASLSELEDPIGRVLPDLVSKSSLSSNGGAAKASNAGSMAVSAAAPSTPALESITRKDVVGALKSLMVAAGLPMSMDQERLAESVMQLKSSMAEERCGSIFVAFDSILLID